MEVTLCSGGFSVDARTNSGHQARKVLNADWAEVLSAQQASSARVDSGWPGRERAGEGQKLEAHRPIKATQPREDALGLLQNDMTLVKMIVQSR